jgi:hypothetical protein
MPYAVTGSEVSEVTFTATFEDVGGNLADVQGSVNVAGMHVGWQDRIVACE